MKTLVPHSAELIKHHADQHLDRCPGGECITVACPCESSAELICGHCLEVVFVVVDHRRVCEHAARLIEGPAA